MRYVICVGASDGPLAALELAPCDRRGGRGRKLHAEAGRWETRS